MHELWNAIGALAIQFLLWLQPGLGGYPFEISQRIEAYLVVGSIALAGALLLVVSAIRRTARPQFSIALMRLIAFILPIIALLAWDAYHLAHARGWWEFRYKADLAAFSIFVGALGLILHTLVWTLLRSGSQWTKLTSIILMMLAAAPAYEIVTRADDFFPYDGPDAESQRMGEGIIGEDGVPEHYNRAWRIVPVLFGTDRRKVLSNARWSFDNGRGRELTLGRAIVTIPITHRRGQIERPAFFSLRTIWTSEPDPDKHFSATNVRLMTHEAFFNALNAKDSALLFIHGFNVDFTSALFRVAQIAWDLNFPGQALLYSWPSRGGTSNYVADLANSEQAQPHLKRLLELVIQNSGLKSVFIIAHSMGNLPFLRVMNEIVASLDTDQKQRVRQIVLAAPDIDEGVFENLAKAIGDLGGATVYASDADKAILASQFLATSGDIQRLGGVAATGPVVAKGFDSIDASAASMDLFALNHSGYAESDALLSDLGALIACGTRPPITRSNSFEAIVAPNGTYWKLKPGRYTATAC